MSNSADRWIKVTASQAALLEAYTDTFYEQKRYEAYQEGMNAFAWDNQIREAAEVCFNILNKTYPELRTSSELQWLRDIQDREHFIKHARLEKDGWTIPSRRNREVRHTVPEGICGDNMSETAKVFRNHADGLLIEQRKARRGAHERTLNALEEQRKQLEEQIRMVQEVRDADEKAICKAEERIAKRRQG